MIQSFADLCNAFTKALVLAHFDPAGPICLKTDASSFAIAGIFSQQQDDVHKGAKGAAHVQRLSVKGHWHPIALWS